MPCASLHKLALRMMALAILLLGASAAHAQDIYLNGVKIERLRNQNFDHAQLRFDDKGDLHITVEGVQVLRKAEGELPAQPLVSQQYWLISQTTPAARCEVEVYLNARFVVKTRSDGAPLAMDVSRYLSPGHNTITFRAAPLDGGSLQQGDDTRFRVFLGAGQGGAGQLIIEDTLVTYERTASTPLPQNQQAEFQAR